MIEAIRNTLIMIRGAGDLATGTAIRLHNSGFPLIMLEIAKPTVIRTTVSFAAAMYTGRQTVEGITAVKASPAEALSIIEEGMIPIVEDPEGIMIQDMKPEIVIDAIIAKRNLGTGMGMAPFTIALGPGFEAGKDVDAVIETQRGHRLGSIIREGFAAPNTGIPGMIGGYGKERVMHSPCQGIFRAERRIGDIVKEGDIVAYVSDTPVRTLIPGKIRGMLISGLEVPEGFKVADVDPRGEKTDHLTVSDKARSIAGGVLEAVMHYLSYGSGR